MSGFEDLLDGLAPGMSRRDDAAAPPVLPRALGLRDPVKIGEGATGWVFRATDPVLGRDVAVKVARPDARDALLAEARQTTRLSHPAVLPLHRVVEADGLTCAEYALAPTLTLGMWLANQRVGEGADWPVPDRLAALVVVSSAVARAHAIGVVHGDLQPDNVLLSDRFEPYVIDWSGDRGVPGTFSGTPGYAAPEQFAGAPPGPAADVFALGALAYSLVTLMPLRPRREGERLADFVHRWKGRATPVPPGVDPLLGELLNQALAVEPAARPNAAEWLRGLRGVVSGAADRTRRHVEAARLANLAQGALTRFRQLELAVVRERQALTVLEAKSPGWTPPAQKRALWAAETRVEQLEDERSRALESAIADASQARAMDPEADEPRQVLADLYWSQLERAELGIDAGAARRAEDRLRELADPRYLRMLDAPGQLEVVASCGAATVRVSRWETVDRIQRAVPVSDHVAPCTITLPRGSYVLDLEAPGHAPVRAPVRVERLQHQRVEVELFPKDRVGPGWIQVPAGSFVMGGDPLARLALPRCEPWVDTFFIGRTCVTSGEWLDFLDDLPADEADALVPGEMGLFGGTPALWRREGGRFVLPDGWPRDLPVLGVNIPQVEAYCAWLSARVGATCRLPTEEEWEKAARGVDGRIYPWGDRFDPTFCHMRSSRPGSPRPAPVASYPADTSPYGVRDTAGGLREWTSSIFDQGQHVIRGGTFGDDAVDCRVASRSGFQPQLRFSYVGFRVARAP